MWSLGSPSTQTLYSFPGEHARSSFFKNIGQGVTQLQVDSGSRLFSCGADGSMKVRQLPDRDVIVQSLYLGKLQFKRQSSPQLAGLSYRGTRVVFST